MTAQSPTLLLRLYGLGTTLAAPFACRLIKRKLTAQGVDPKRFPERAGVATLPRPKGQLIWLHAASVGETLSLLRLIEQLGQMHPAHHFLLTSGTATSAQIVADRLPARTTHQFAPLDSGIYLRRFLDHWQPSAAIFVESELWPQMMRTTAARGIPLALVNARISDKSAQNWKRVSKTAAHLMGLFSMIHCQDARTADHLADLGLHHAKQGPNLKSFSGHLPYDESEFARLRNLLGKRPIWLAASTHPGEDQMMLNAHRSLLAHHPDLLLLLVPRHPERAGALEVLIAEEGLVGARRSTGGKLTDQTQVYLADTLGELGLWYALCPRTCLCGSFVPVGGHNPYEAAYAGSAVVHGPLYANFAQTYAEMDATGGAFEVADEAGLSDKLSHLLASPVALHQMATASRAFADAQEDALTQIAADLSKALSVG